MHVTRQHEAPHGRTTPIALAALAAAAFLAGLVTWVVQRHVGDTSTPAQVAQPAPAVTITSRDGSLTFRVPKPGDPEYPDYQEMLRHPSYRSSAEGRPGYALPYDPEWRSVIAGKRQVAPIHFALDGGAGSMEQLGQALLAALRAADADKLVRLRVGRQEFETLLWPEFPQSRPYLRIDPEDAWMMHHNSSASAVASLLHTWGGRELELIGVDYGNVVQYTNFTLYQDVRLRVRGAGTADMFEITEVPAIVGCNGQFKTYTYRG
jgi:hypothetical protein